MGTLLGRSREVAAVRAAIAAGARLVLLTGPQGVGKSRLARAAAPDAVVVPARAALRGPSTRVVLVEDAHRAGAGRLAALVRHARSGTGPVLLATARDIASGPLPAALDGLAATPSALVMPVHGLPDGAVATLAEALLGAPVGVRAAQRLRERTGGRPYWIEQLAHAARDPATRQGIDTVPLPALAAAGLVAPVEAVVASVGPDARRLAEAAAVLGDRAGLELLAAVLGGRRRVGSWLPALRALVDAGVLTDADGPVRFRDALTGEAVAGRVPATERREWHARAHRESLRTRADDAIVAAHAAGAGRWTEVTGPATRAAAAALADGSNGPALRLAELALIGSDGDRACRAHELAARAAYAAGYLDDADRHARSWRAATPEPVAAHCLLASLRWSAGDTAGQWTELDAALAAARASAAPGALATVLAARANALTRAERHTDAIDEADRAIAAADRCGAGAERRSALVDKGTALGHGGDPDAGLAVLAVAERECAAADDRLNLGRALNNALWPRLARLTAAEGWATFDRTYGRARSLGLTPVLGKLARQGGDLARHTGRWASGWAIVTGRLPEEGDPSERATLAAKAALLALDAGRPDDAVPLAERATADALGMDQFWVRAYIALLDVALTAHRFPPTATVRALTRYRTAMTPAEHARRPERAWQAARYALDAGVEPGVVRAFTAATLPGGFPPGPADAAALALADRLPDAAAAGERLTGGSGPAAAWLDRAGAVERADALIRLGRVRLRLGSATGARGCADEAAVLLAEWPGPLADAARALRAATGADGPTLTGRERDVHALIVEGLTNRAIGERLGLSTRTVAVHVSRILAKTGRASRTELIAHALRT